MTDRQIAMIAEAMDKDTDAERIVTAIVLSSERQPGRL